MLQLDLKTKFLNPTFDIALAGAILVFLKSCHLDFIANVIPNNYADIISQFIGILVMLGVIINPNTKGISDQVVTDTTVQALSEQSTNNNSITIPLAGDTLSDSVKKILQDNNLINNDDNKVNFNDTGMTTTGDLKVVSQDSTSQVEIKDNSVNASVQDNNASSKVIVDIPQE